MVRHILFDRGDIIRVSLNPTRGRELQGETRPALVLSKKIVNALGTVLVAPFTQGGNIARDAGFAVPLSGSGTETQGVVLVNAIRTLDLIERGAIKVETAPDIVITDVLARLMTVIE